VQSVGTTGMLQAGWTKVQILIQAKDYLFS